MPVSCLQLTSKVKFGFQPTNNLSEDCLYVNIWCPTTIERWHLLPVVVFFPGGAYFSGGIAIDYYNGKYLASRGIVVVTFNSRVGNFGFLNLNIHDALGNQGIFDQSTALKWIDPNMAEFEGDMNNMTLFGEGSGSVSFHLTNKITRHYANKAILFGGTGYFPPYIMDANSSLGLSQEFAELAKCADKTKTVFNNTQEVLECLQSKPADDLLGYENISHAQKKFLPRRLSGIRFLF
ncbi:BCHE [Cordylochernes scorpioides]|uniref:BCHE n=1 Tax=Cordylochernes scorpioides TaxID=51811 RepID=A0ABY6KN50_9ARAC|nr:BCHE [Cordylochernes scorpioides]